MPIRLASGLGSINEADAFKHAADNGADVISCSWGPADGDGSIPAIHFTIMSNRFRRALETHLSMHHSRRGGKGCVVLFAAGNGRDPSTTMAMRVPARRCGCGLQRYFSTQCVQRLRKGGLVLFYKQRLWRCRVATTQSVNNRNLTTDRTGAPGYNRGNLASGDARELYQQFWWNLQFVSRGSRCGCTCNFS